MTTWSWKCRSCGYEFINPIFRFIPKCPECEVEYIKLAAANGSPSIGIMPIYALVGEDIRNESTKNSVKFAIATKATNIECFSYEFYLYLQENFSSEFSKRNISLVYNEIKK